MSTLSNVDHRELLVPEWLKPFAVVRFDWGDNNPNNKVVHIRAIVDDCQVVSRWWSKHKQRWIYELQGPYWYWLCVEQGHAVFAGIDKE